MNERHAAFLLRKNQFEVANGEAVEPHVFFFVEARQPRNVSHVFVFGSGQIVQNHARRHDSLGQIFYAKAFERGRLKVSREQRIGKVGGESPVFEAKGVELVAKKIGKFLAVFFTKKHFGRRETLQQFFDVGAVSLGGQKLARRNV